MTSLEKVKERFKDADIDMVGKLFVVHLDNPSKAERAKRIESPLDLALEDDCPLCQEMAGDIGIVVIDHDSVLLLSNDNKRLSGVISSMKGR